MIEWHWTGAVLFGMALGACTPVVKPPHRPSCGLMEESMSDHTLKIRETAQPELSGYLVGVSNIWERDQPGGAANRVAATLSITDPTSKHTRREEVFEGSIVSLGSNRYCVVAVEEGKSSPGSITLRKAR